MSPYPSPTGRPSTGYNTKPISSFFTPHKKPEEEKNDRPKIAVKNVLKSNNLTTLYNPIKKPGSPFSLSRSNSNSSSTENLADNLARFRFDSDTKSPLRDLNSPTSFRKLKQRLDSDSEESADENMDASPQRILRARKPIKKPAPLVFSSDEEEEEEEEEVQGEPDSKVDVIKKRKIFSDSEDDNDDDPLMDDDEVYVDQNEVINKSLESTSEQENIERVQRIHPNKSVQEIQDAIRHAGSVVAACKLLMSDQGIPKQKRRRLVDEDDQEIQARKQLSERQRELLVLKYFNTCTAQDLQEVTGCKSEAAEKITEQLRPFADMDDLEEKLKRTKGTSVKYIQSCQEMMDGYTAVDQIIEKIENLGSKLRYILNIWEGASRSNSPTNEEEDEESQPGMNMTNVDIDVRREKSDPVYKDAMDGYLTEQPNCVDEDITLKDYQILGVNWMLLLYRKGISGILADEMGLGKTCQVITFLGRLNELGDSGPHLIVVPSSTIENWVREFERFCPDLEVRLYHGSINERAELRAELKYENKMRIFQVILTTYQIAAGHIDDRTFLRKLKCRSMILDEGHMVKNCASGRYARLMNIQTPFRLLLTGTPLQNSLQELVSLLIFIMPETFANHEEEVRSIFKIRAQSTSAKEKDKKRKDETSVQVLSKARIMRAKKMMTPFVLRRKKQDVLKDIPNKTQIIERCTMTENQAQVYSDIILNSKKSYEASLDDTEKKSDMKKQFESMTNIVIHLRKAADHPLLFRKIYTDELLREMAKEIRRDVKYWDSEEEYIYEDMTYMSDFELHNLCRENRVSFNTLK